MRVRRGAGSLVVSALALALALAPSAAAHAAAARAHQGGRQRLSDFARSRPRADGTERKPDGTLYHKGAFLPLGRAAAPSAHADGAAPAPRSPAGGLTEVKREEIALRAVEKDVRPWLPRGVKALVRPNFIQYSGDSREPITGRGPVAISIVRDPGAGTGFFGRLFGRFQRFGSGTFYVDVDPRGTPAILTYESSLHQAARRLHLLEFASDLVRSRGVREGLGLGIVGGAAGTTVSPALGGAAVMAALKMMADGIGRRHQARQHALLDTVTWAEQTRTADGRYPTLMESYRFFQGRLADLKPGTYAWSLGEFAEKLSVHNL